MKKAIIVVYGKDRTGIIYNVTKILFENNINVLDIKQTIVDGYFNMMTISDVTKTKTLNKVKKSLEEYGKKVSLNIKSYAQLQNRHDNFNRNDDAYYQTHTGTVNIPKNSKFKDLREYLPEDFEWIIDRKRLILETELQHHCVWSYADKISRDQCAIYSYLDRVGDYSDKPRRYTIEFGYEPKQKKYQVIQVQGRYDRVNSNNMREYIQNILDDCQKTG
jgi:ACT domain-containing protein